MIQKSIIKIGLAAILSLSTLIAQDEFIEKKDDVVIVEDEAMKLVGELQHSKVPVVSQNAKDSIDLLQDYLDKRDIAQGWDNSKNRIVQVATAEFDCDNPAYDDNFMHLRLMATIQAKLIAKAKIIESIRTVASASDQLEMPDNPIYNKFKKQKDDLEDRLKMLKRKMKVLSSNVKDKEIENIEGVTLSDRLNSFMDGVITKVDNSYSKENISRDKKNQVIQAKREFRKLKHDYDNLISKAEGFKNKLISTTTSSISTYSEQPLYGASIVAQSESWNHNRYSVSLAVVWSAKMHRAAEAVLLGKKVKIAKANKTKTTLNEWIRNRDLSSMTGGRIYTDNDGVMHFVGIAAMPYDDDLSSSKRFKYRTASNDFAKKEAILALYSFINSKSETKMVARVLSVKDGSNRNEVALKMAKKIVSKIKNKTFQGLSQIRVARVIHPISKRKIYVSVYAVNQEFANKAIIIESINYKTQQKDRKYEEYKKAQKENLKNNIEYTQKNNKQNNFNKPYSTSKQKNRKPQNGAYMDEGSINSEDW